MKKIIFFTLSIFAFIKAGSQTVYVSGDGTGDYNCDGTSDQVEINQALDFVAANSGYTTVYLKGPHTYYVDETIFISSNTIFTGDSSAKIELIENAGWWTEAKPMIAQKGRITQWNYFGDYGDDISNVEIFGFEISGGLVQEEPSGGTYLPIIHFCSPHNVSIHDMHLHDSHWDVVRFTSSGGENGDEPQDCNHSKVYNNLIEYAGHEGVMFVFLKNFEVYNNKVYSTRTNCGIRLKDTDVFDVHDNIIGNSLTKISGGFAGILVENEHSPLTEHAEIFNNVIYGKNGGIHLGSDGNVENTPYPLGTRKNVHIHHNKLYQTKDGITSTGFLMDGGITIAGYDSTLIEHNIIDGSTTDGIIFKPELAGGTGYKTIIRNNIIMNVADTALNNRDASINTFVSDNNLFYNNGVNYRNASSTTDIDDAPLFATTNSTLHQWHHIVATYSNSTEVMRIFVDGKEKASREFPGFGAIASNTHDLFLGGYRGIDYWFEGKQDELAVWNRALSVNEINQLYNDGTPVNIQGDMTQGLQAYYKMENNWDDSSGNNANAVYSAASFSTDALSGTHAGLFDGIDDYVQYPNTLSTTNGITISVWTYRTGGDEIDQSILNKGAQGNNDHIWLYFREECVEFDIGNGSDRVAVEADVIAPWEIDYHVQSEFGRFDGTSWVNDAVTSPCVDGGYLLSDYANEPAPNGGRVNIGVYGNTPEASKSSTTGLPVELLNFNALKEGRQVMLIWQTASEQNSDYFIVEQSTDAKTFSTLERVKAQGESNAIHNYKVLDKNPAKGMNYYRLKQMDMNGKFSYSKIIWVAMDEDIVSFYPNPASKTISFNKPIESIIIRDLQGKEVLSRRNIRAVLDISTLQPGVYIMDINGRAYKDRFIVE